MQISLRYDENKHLRKAENIFFLFQNWIKEKRAGGIREEITPPPPGELHIRNHTCIHSKLDEFIKLSELSFF